MKTDNLYLESQFKSWEEKKNEIRKNLPNIYKNSNDEIKAIIEMLVESEYKNAIMTDNEIRRNANERKEKTNKDKNAQTYLEENKELFELIG